MSMINGLWIFASLAANILLVVYRCIIVIFFFLAHTKMRNLFVEYQFTNLGITISTIYVVTSPPPLTIPNLTFHFQYIPRILVPGHSIYDFIHAEASGLQAPSLRRALKASSGFPVLQYQRFSTTYFRSVGRKTLKVWTLAMTPQPNTSSTSCLWITYGCERTPPLPEFSQPSLY